MSEVLDNEIANAIEESVEEQEGSCIATIGAVGQNGVTLIFPGDTTSGGKYYRVNPDALFKAGDKVIIRKESGSCIVEEVIGKPMDRYPIPSGGNDGQVLTKDGTDSYSVKWADASAASGIPSGGAKGQVLSKNSATDNDLIWETISGYTGPTINGSGTSSLGFYGGTARSKSTCYLTRKATGITYSSVTSSNYLQVLNNLVGILAYMGLINSSTNT